MENGVEFLSTHGTIDFTYEIEQIAWKCNIISACG